MLSIENDAPEAPPRTRPDLTMPRQPAVPHETLLGVLKAHHQQQQIVDGHGQIYGPTAAVWSEIAQKLEFKLTPRYIYQFVKENRHDSQVILEINRPPTPLIDETMDESSIVSSINGVAESPDCTIDFASPSDAKSMVQPKKTFKLIFTADEWQQIQPKKITYTRKDRAGVRIRDVFPQHAWANVVVKKIWENHKLPCPYTITRGQVASSEGTEYAKIRAICKECGARATGLILSKPVEGESVSIMWRAHDTRTVPHSRSRCLSGEERRTVASKLKGQCASVFQKEMALNTMDQGDLKPPHLWPTHVLRKAKQEGRTEELGIKGPTNPVLNLSIMKHGRYAGSIHDVSLDKFYVHYFTAAQMLIFKKYCASAYTKLSVDATGGVVKKIDGPGNHTSGYIFLYEAVFSNDLKKGNLPACQMLSEKHDTNTIVYWLNEWRRAGAPVPNEVVIDNSAALKSAVTKVFAGTDIMTYKNQCLNYLISAGGPLPKCFIRLDVAHFISAACKWSFWADKSKKRLKYFYMKCLGALLNAEELQEYEEILESVLVVALSPAEKDRFQNPLPMEEKLSFLGRVISGDNAITPIDDDDEVGDVTDHFLDLDPADNDGEGSALHSWVKTVQQNAIDSIQDDPEGRPNPYHCPTVADEFLRTASEFVLWSNVMTRGFGTPFKRGTSAPIESEFADLKCRVLKGESKPLKVDTFVATHINAIEGACRLADMQPIRAQEIKSSEVELNDCEMDDLNNRENWRGLGQPKHKAKYVTAMPGADLDIHKKILKAPANRLLKNGSSAKPVTASGTVLLVKNTCTFDSVCHLVANSYTLFECYRDQMANSVNNLVKTAKSLAHDGATAKTYEARAEALAAVLEPQGQLDIPPTRRRTLALEYDAYGNVAALLNKLMVEPHASLRVTCEVPNHTTNKTTLDPDSRALTELGIVGLEEALVTLIRCDKCRVTYGPHIFVDVEFLTQGIPGSNSSTARHYALAEIPRQLLLGEQEFKLSGVVHYSTFHYIAYCCNAQHWTEFDDLHAKEKSVKDSTKVWPSILMYVKV